MDELERICMEAVVTYFKELSCHLSARTKKKYKNPTEPDNFEMQVMRVTA
jgi:hypothetical protein